MASSSTIPLLRFRFFWLEYIPQGIVFPIVSACSSELISIFLRTADFRTLHYDGRAGGSRTLRYGFPLLTSFGLGAGDRFDPQSLGIGVGFRFGVVGG